MLAAQEQEISYSKEIRGDHVFAEGWRKGLSGRTCKAKIG